MDVYFIRHHVLAKETLQLLTRDGYKFGVAYGNISSTDPAAYQGRGANAMKLMHRLADSDALICASYGDVDGLRRSLFVGRTVSGSKVTVLEGTGEGTPLEAIKCLPMRQVRAFPFSKYPVLATLMPRQGTIGRGWNLAPVIIPLYESGSLSRSVYSLSPSQLEVLCYEYLRDQKLLDHLVLPIGRTLMDVDIVGIRNGSPVYAQVTFAKSSEESAAKARALCDFGGERGVQYMFAPKAHQADLPGTTFLAIEDVYAHYAAAGSHQLLDALFGLADLASNEVASA